MRFTDPSWRERPLHTVARVGESIVRRRVARLCCPVVDVGYGLRIHTDLNSALGLGLFRYGIREPEVVLLERLLAPGDTFVDGAAHIGVFALIAARLVGPAGKVIAFEPAIAARHAREYSVSELVDVVQSQGMNVEVVRTANYAEMLGRDAYGGALGAVKFAVYRTAKRRAVRRTGRLADRGATIVLLARKDSNRSPGPAPDFML